MGSKFIKSKGPAYTVSYKRPFNNKKRTKGRSQQVKAEKAWKGINELYKKIEDEGEHIHDAEEN